MRTIRPIAWLPLFAVAGPLLVSCAERSKPSFVGPNGPPDELALQECSGEVAKAQVSGTAPADVRAEVAQGAMTSCMAKKGFYLQRGSDVARGEPGGRWLWFMASARAHRRRVSSRPILSYRA
jgi:hypothetical protein